MAKKTKKFSLEAPKYPHNKAEDKPYLSNWPSIEEYDKLGDEEKDKIYDEVWVALRFLKMRPPSGCWFAYLHAGADAIASGITSFETEVFVEEGGKTLGRLETKTFQIKEKCVPWAKALAFFEKIRYDYLSTIPPEKRAKLAETKPVDATGDAGKWKALMHYGQIGANVAGGTLAGYEKFADIYNNYMDYKVSKLAAGQRCKYDDDGSGGIIGSNEDVKCKNNAECPPGHICVGAAQQGVETLQEGLSFAPDGTCIPSCANPVFIDFFDDTKEPKMDFGGVLDLLDSLAKQPPPLSSCIAPHFENFFYVIPWQYWLMKNLESMVDSLLLQGQINQLNQQIQQHTSCGVDSGLDLDMIKQGAHLPNIGDLLDNLNIFPLPPLPYFQWPPPGLPSILKILLDPLNVIRVIILDLLCWSICLVLNPIIFSVLAIMNEDIKNRFENYDEFTGTPSPSLPSESSMKKSDVNKEVSNDILRQAHNLGYVVLQNPKVAKGNTSINAGHQHIFQLDKNGNGYALEVCHPMSENVCHSHEVKRWVVQSEKSSCYPKCKQRYGHSGVPTHVHKIDSESANSQVREYIRTVNYEKRMTVKDLITLLAGDATCYVKGILIEIGKRSENASLELTQPNKILQFWQYLGNNIDMFSFIEKSRQECEPDICPTPINEQLLNDLLREMDKACSLLKKPENLLPLEPEDMQKMAISIGNKILEEAGHGDSKLDPNDESAIIPKETQLKEKLNKRCQDMRRVEDDDPGEGYTAGKYYEYYKKKIEDWTYGDDEETIRKIIVDGGVTKNPSKYTALKWCGGTREGEIPPKKKADKGADEQKQKPKCQDPNMNFGKPKSSLIKPLSNGTQPCLYIFDDDKQSSWNSNHIKKWKPSSATKYNNVVKSLDVWYGTDKELLHATIDSMTPVEKEWICRRNTWPGGPNRHDWSLMYNICDDLNWMEKETIAKKLGCKCKS